MLHRILAGLLCLVLVAAPLPLSACGTTIQSENLMEGVQQQNALLLSTARTQEETEAIADFDVRLFQSGSASGESALISPLSVLCALAMTANGANGETLSQMEQVFGLSDEELNNFLGAYLSNLPSSDKYKVSVANSIWLKDDDTLTVNPSFLQQNANYYGASVYRAAFDNTTPKDINAWVSDYTNGMVDHILDNIPKDAVIYLINALSFDAQWEEVYNESQVEDGIFTMESGETQTASMMYGTEYRYLDDGSATGFIKYYADRSYAFVALLPNEGISVSDYVASLTGEGMMNMLSQAEDTTVRTAIPKFQCEYSVEMSDILKNMGITDAFDAGKADFSGLGQSENGALFISHILHKAYIAVEENGTRAGAATAIEIDATSAPNENPKTVYLNRPFVYMLIDCETNLPLFIGTEMTVSQ
ncbi:MAG: proteinase inhibitor serpin [Oscillospiraceae bacterium]|nr:proteinase inhibitor serpin [Oscillospiraceae bacterium]